MSKFDFNSIFRNKTLLDKLFLITIIIAIGRILYISVLKYRNEMIEFDLFSQDDTAPEYTPEEIAKNTLLSAVIKYGAIVSPKLELPEVQNELEKDSKLKLQHKKLMDSLQVFKDSKNTIATESDKLFLLKNILETSMIYLAEDI